MTAPAHSELLFPDPPLPPGAWLGLLGGGQLGRMFCMAAQSLGFKVCVLDPASDSPAGAVADRQIVAAYDDAHALQELARLCRAVTTEFENVPAQALDYLAKHCVVSPGAGAVEIAQHRIREKIFIQSCGLEVAPYHVIDSPASFELVSDDFYPAILKVARFGYDGKGQATVHNRADLQRAFKEFGEAPCVLEQRLALEQELSVVIGRDFTQKCMVYPVSCNVHRAGILFTSIAPAQIPQALADSAATAARLIADRLEYVGILCVELFVVGGQILVNEIAPRPHNSGHFTIDACVTSQFEQQARILAGLPMGGVRQHSCSTMVNIMGDAWFVSDDQHKEPQWSEVLRYPEAKLHLYGKAQARKARKMGHITVLGETASDAANVSAQLIERLGLRH
jgi:5-(carboxyamino)imidazole ribonucleotide synthase